MQLCTVCKTMKETISFVKDKRRPGGFGSCCKKCAYASNKKTREKIKYSGLKKTYKRTCILCKKEQTLVGKPRSHRCSDCRKRTHGQRILSLKDRKLSKGGYITMRVNRTSKYLHRIIVENDIGRKLSKAEFVHHVDGNKLNNDISNLEIISNSDHAKIHCTKEKAKVMSKLAHQKRWG